MDTGKSDILKAKEASEVLGISTGTLYKLVRAKEIPHRKLKKQIRFSRQALEEFIKTGEPGTPERE